MVRFRVREIGPQNRTEPDYGTNMDIRKSSQIRNRIHVRWPTDVKARVLHVTDGTLLLAVATPISESELNELQRVSDVTQLYSATPNLDRFNYSFNSTAREN